MKPSTLPSKRQLDVLQSLQRIRMTWIVFGLVLALCVFHAGWWFYVVASTDTPLLMKVTLSGFDGGLGYSFVRIVRSLFPVADAKAATTS